MMQNFLLLGLPYLALIVCVVGSIQRYRLRRFTYSALSSQFLEDRQLAWGSIPWHVGILTLLLGHVFALGLPGLWASLTANTAFLYSVEVIGVAASVLAIVGLVLLAVRRLTTGRVQAVTTVIDLALLGLLLVQIVLGLTVAMQYPWGASWSTGTVAPYLWSVLTLRPDPTFVVDMPALMHAHLALAWVMVGLVPFSRLVHVFSLPFQYLFRPPQVVVWANARRQMAALRRHTTEPTRRYFLRGAAGLAAGGSLLAIGTADKLGRFFLGPRVSEEQKAELMEKRLLRLRQTTREKELELERNRQEYIRVARLGELDEQKGKYFIDYEMRPSLAFRDASGLPILISAKCTHLGCTVGSQLDAAGRILCPCHVSYFDIRTGQPNDGAPAKAPLPHLGWVLMDSAGQIVASQRPGRPVQGDFDFEQLDQLDGLDVYIGKGMEEQA